MGLGILGPLNAQASGRGEGKCYGYAQLARAEGRIYESAEALLARIQAERRATAKPSKDQRGRTLRANART